MKGVGCLSVGVKFWLIWLIEGGGCTQMRETGSPEINHHKLKKQIMLTAHLKFKEKGVERADLNL